LLTDLLTSIILNIKLPMNIEQYSLWTVANTIVTGYFMENDRIGGYTETVSTN